MSQDTMTISKDEYRTLKDAERKLQRLTQGDDSDIKRLPESWIKAAGLLRGKRKAMDRHLKKVRSEWDSRVPKA